MDLSEIDKAADEFMQSLYDGIGKEITSHSITKYGPVNASGRLLRSRVVAKVGLSRTLAVNRYAYQLVFGRKPGTPPPVSAIRLWLREKGLDLNEYAVAKSIAKKGTVIFQTYHGAESGLFSDTINEQAFSKFSDQIAGLWAAEVTSEGLKAFKQ